MPNWCNVTLTLQAPRERLEEVLAAIAGEGKQCIDFDKIIPEDVFNPEYQCAPDRECLTPHKENPRFNWLRWRMDYWGSKWNACRTSKSDVRPVGSKGVRAVDISFRTAWFFPEPVMVALSWKFPDVVMSAVYVYEGDNISYQWQSNYKEDKQ